MTTNPYDGKFVRIRNEHTDNRLLAQNRFCKTFVRCIALFFIRTTRLLSQVERQPEQQQQKQQQHTEAGII